MLPKRSWYWSCNVIQADFGWSSKPFIFTALTHIYLYSLQPEQTCTRRSSSYFMPSHQHTCTITNTAVAQHQAFNSAMLASLIRITTARTFIPVDQSIDPKRQLLNGAVTDQTSPVWRRLAVLTLLQMCWLHCPAVSADMPQPKLGGCLMGSR